MDLKLFLRILTQAIFIMFIIIGVHFLLTKGSFELRVWIFIILVYSILDYLYYVWLGKKLGITRASKDYLKTNFFELLESNTSEQQLLNKIKYSNEYLGKVYLNNEVIRKQKYVGMMKMSVSYIEVSSGHSHLKVKLTTNPVFKFLPLDYYANYKCFNLLKEIIT